MTGHVEFGVDEYCSDCNQRALLVLDQSNRCFERWVKELEEKYDVNHVSSLPPSIEDFSDGLKERERLIGRFHSVRNKLMSSKQMRDLQQVDSWYSECYEDDLVW